MHLNRVAKFIVAVAFILAAGLIVHRYRIRIHAWFWQAANHGTLKFEAYLVTVPKGWYVSDDGPQTRFLVLWTPHGKTPEGTRLPVTVNLSKEEPLDINRWSSLEISLAQRGGKPILQRDFDLGNERMVCFGQEITPKFPRLEDKPVGWTCRSSAGLEIQITASEADIQEAWDIVSQIKPAGLSR